MKTNQNKPIRTSMFSVRCWMLNVAVLATASSALAGVHYVDVNSTNATPPYSNWTTAARNIQDAVDAAAAGDEVVVTNGAYACVSVGDIVVRSVNGPQFTVIHGSFPFQSIPGSRCAELTGDASSLSGFRLANGYADNDPYFPSLGGGGVFSWAPSAVVSNCVIAGNMAVDPPYGIIDHAYGGGAYGCTLINCTLSGNSHGGGG